MYFSGEIFSRKVLKMFKRVFVTIIIIGILMISKKNIDAVGIRSIFLYVYILYLAMMTYDRLDVGSQSKPDLCSIYY